MLFSQTNKMKTSQYDLLKAGTEWIINGETHQLLDWHRNDPGSQLAYITLGFNQARFGSVNRRSTGDRKFDYIGRISSELFDRYRGWYIQMVRDSIHDYRRASARKRQPKVFAFIDDQNDGTCRPHIHSLMLIPSTITMRLSTKLGVGGRQVWNTLEPRGEYHVAFVSADDVGSVMKYNAKLYTKYSLIDSVEILYRKFPDSIH